MGEETGETEKSRQDTVTGDGANNLEDNAELSAIEQAKTKNASLSASCGKTNNLVTENGNSVSMVKRDGRS